VVGFANRQRVPLFLLLVAVITGLVTFRIYPRTPPVTAAGGIQRITLIGPLRPTSVDVDEQPDGHAGVLLDVGLRAPAPPTQSLASERIVVAVTTTLSGRCPPAALACPSGGGARTLYYQFHQQPWSDLGAGSIETDKFVVIQHMDIPGVEPNVAQDSQDIAASLPPVAVVLYAYTPGLPVPALAFATDPPSVNFGEKVAHGQRYTWEGAVPIYTQGQDRWVYSAASSPVQELDSIQDTGIDKNVQDHNSTLIFVAGVLLGVAIAALLGAVQAAITPAPK
jgi:hypothetical protein